MITNKSLTRGASESPGFGETGKVRVVLMDMASV